MAFADLYQEVQAKDHSISTLWLKEEAIEQSSITRIREQWSGIADAAKIRGWYIEGPQGQPVVLGENEALIVLARGMCTGPLGDHWRRFVYTKELMHVFDENREKAHNEKTFDVQVEKFGDPSADPSPQFRAESKAYWRALAVLCPAKTRLGYKAKMAKNKISLDVVAAGLRIPATHATNLFRPDFEQIIANVLK